MARARKPRVKEPKVPLTPEQRKIRRLARAENRKLNPPRERELPVDFDWSTIKKFDGDLSNYVYRCSCKCLRTSENSPLSICGEGAYGQFRNAKGKLRWMMSFKKRSQRDEMIRDGKTAIGRKVKKEPNKVID